MNAPQATPQAHVASPAPAPTPTLTPEEEMDFYSRLQAKRHLSDFNTLRLLTEANQVAGALPAKQAGGLLKILGREKRRLERELRPAPKPAAAETGADTKL